MSISRRFLIAPALVRLIRKERGGSRITEGHFAPQGGRASYVRVDGQTCHLVLVNDGVEERTDVPRAHGDALLDVCPGKAAYDRTTLSAAGREIVIDRYVTPGGLDLVTVAFDGEDQARAFAPPSWFGREVTGEATYERPALAIQGVPATEEMSVGNAALESLLDLIEPRFGFGRYGSGSRSNEAGEGSVGAMRRPSPPLPSPAAAPATSPLAAALSAPPSVPAPEAPKPASEPAPIAAAMATAAAPITFDEPAPAEAEHGEAFHHEHEGETRHAEAAEPEQPAGSSPAEAVHGDARIDDVIESLSAALGAAIHQNPAQPTEKQDPGTVFERWTVRPRRTQNQG